MKSVESAGELLMLAGWQDRSLEIMDVGRSLRNGDAAKENLDGVASLANKPTLTRAEAHQLLRSM